MRKCALKSILFFCYGLMLCTCSLLAQTTPKSTGNWLMFFNQSRVAGKWSTHAEVQYRSFSVAPNTEQLLLRTGIIYHFTNDWYASTGYAFITNHASDKDLFPGVLTSENRTWQQFAMRDKYGRVLFEHRYRIEQRWISSKYGKQYFNRLRYQLRLAVPLNKTKVERRSIFLSFYDELFIHFSESPFDRNRCSGTIGYQLLDDANVQVGYLAQTVQRTTRHHVQLSIIYNPDFRKKDAKH